jgi:formylglycine-generating enzyme
LTSPVDQDRADKPTGMAWIPGGTFLMGSEEFYPEERPVHEVSVDGFWMDERQVTNHQFARFVEATGYITVAERPLECAPSYCLRYRPAARQAQMVETRP